MENINSSNEVEKAIRPEVTKEQLGMVVEHLMEAIESMIEVPEEETEDTESEDSTEIEDMSKSEDGMEDTEGCECEGCKECKANGGCTQKMCSGHKKVEKSAELSDEEISKSYESDNEEEDKWDNMEKACWSGYKQVGMKEKGGRMVPNCVPVKKSIFGTEGPQTLIPRNK
jgi:hypothetical protein